MASRMTHASEGEQQALFEAFQAFVAHNHFRHVEATLGSVQPHAMPLPQSMDESNGVRQMVSFDQVDPPRLRHPDLTQMKAF